MPARNLEVLIGAAYQTARGNWDHKVLYLNEYAWKQILMGNEERNIKTIDKVQLDLKDEDNSNVLIIYNSDKIVSFRLYPQPVINNAQYGNGMVYFYIKTDLSKWSAN